MSCHVTFLFGVIVSDVSHKNTIKRTEKCATDFVMDVNNGNKRIH